MGLGQGRLYYRVAPVGTLEAGKLLIKRKSQDFPGGAVVKNPPANAGDTVSSPGPGRSHMPWSN